MACDLSQIEAYAREAVREVFQSMLSMELVPEPPAPLTAELSCQIAGSVGFIGESSGFIYLYAGVDFANYLTSRMLGIDEIESEEMVNDAFGELSNMVGGYVKSRLSDSGWPCTLTIPSIVRGQQLSIEGVAQVSRRVIGFRDGSNHLLVELLVKQSSS